MTQCLTVCQCKHCKIILGKEEKRKFRRRESQQGQSQWLNSKRRRTSGEKGLVLSFQFWDQHSIKFQRTLFV